MKPLIFAMASALMTTLTIPPVCATETAQHAEREVASLVAQPASDAPEAVADAFAAALRAGNTAAVRLMLAPNVIIAETGGAERSLEEYVGRHMSADMAFSAAVQFTLQKRDVIQSGDMATVVSQSRVDGQFHGRSIHSRSMETMVLRRLDQQWRIVHIHWSSSPIAD